LTSPVFSDSHPRQLTLELDEGLLARYRNVRECVAQGVYQRGLTWVADMLARLPEMMSAAGLQAVVKAAGGRGPRGGR